MSLLTRQAIGFLSVAAIGYLIAFANPDERLGEVAGMVGMLIAIIGFGTLAWSMLKPEGEPRSTPAAPRRRGSASDARS